MRTFRQVVSCIVILLPPLLLFVLLFQEQQPSRRGFEARRGVERGTRGWRRSTPTIADGRALPIPHGESSAASSKPSAEAISEGDSTVEPANAGVQETPLRPGEEADEILAIRRRLGGSLLEGSLFAVSEEEQIAYRNDIVEAIRSAAQEDLQAAAAADHLQVSAPAHLPSGCDNAAGEGACEPSTPEAVAALRDAADMLDTAAQVLERQEQYQRADDVRELARQMRCDARGACRGGQASVAMRPHGLSAAMTEQRPIASMAAAEAEPHRRIGSQGMLDMEAPLDDPTLEASAIEVPLRATVPAVQR